MDFMQKNWYQYANNNIPVTNKKSPVVTINNYGADNVDIATDFVERGSMLHKKV